MDEYKSVQKYLKHQEHQKKSMSFRSIVIGFLNRTLLSGILLLTVLCLIKMNPETKEYVYKNLYQQNFSFAHFQEMYQKYFGNLFPEDLTKSITGEQMVFKESFHYKKKEDYQNGVRCNVGKGYLMPVLESGIIVFMGNKEGYGETIIIQQVNGIDAWYVGVTFNDLKLYDYVEKGSLLGEVSESDVELYFQQEGSFVDYKNIIS